MLSHHHILVVEFWVYQEVHCRRALFSDTEAPSRRRRSDVVAVVAAERQEVRELVICSSGLLRRSSRLRLRRRPEQVHSEAVSNTPVCSLCVLPAAYK